MTEQEIAAASNCFTCMSPEQLQAAQVYLLEQIRIGGGAAWPYVLRAGDTMTGPLVNSTNGALSTPAFKLTGAPITGGSATTTKPLVLIETSGATSSGWSTSGTMLGVNAPSGFSGRILDLQVNGSSQFLVGSGGAVTMNGTLTLNTSAAQITFSDTILVRDGVANTLALRNGANLQNFRIYGTYTDAGNNEYLSFESGSTVFDIKTVANGTGTANSLRLGTGGTARWQIDTSGHYTAVTDNTYDIGASGANRPRNLFIAGGITHGSATLLTTTTALTNGAAAQVATLTNGPTAGNPTKWIPINDNGTTRYIPAW